MPVSSALAEKRQMSVAATPEAGRCNGMGFPAREQELVAVEKTPRAATLRSTSAFGMETPAVVGSTTMMSWAGAEGALLGREMIASAGVGAITMGGTLLEGVAFGLRNWEEGIAGGGAAAGGSGGGDLVA